VRALIVVNQGPLGPGSSSALKFCRAWLDAGHAVERVFFYHDGVLNGLAAVATGSEPDLTADWARLSSEHDLDLVLCVGAAQRRGVLDEAMAAETGALPTLAAGFRIAGLGQWMDALLEADRVIRFGGA